MKRAEGHLLEALYGHITSLGKFETDSLLEEDPDTMQRRAATRKVCVYTLNIVINGKSWVDSHRVVRVECRVLTTPQPLCELMRCLDLNGAL